MATEQWLRALDKNSGRYYYWNTTTRESRWDIEDHLKPAGDRTKKRNPKDDGKKSEKKQAVEKEPEDENNTKEKLEARREKAAKEENRIGLEHMLATIGWAGARAIPAEVITQSIEPYAKPYRFKEEETLAKFFEACKKKLEEDRAEIERLASEADQLVKDAEEAAQKAKMALDGDDSRRQLFEFLTKQTAVQREEEKAAQLAAYRARAEKRAREKERMDHIGANPDSARSRPKREIKQRFVEKGGFMVLKENTPDESKPKPVYKERKQPPSAYALFSKDFIKEMKENGIKMDFATVQKAIAAKWKTVDENGRAPYYEAAKLERERILAERLAESESPVPDDSQMEVEGSPAPPSDDASRTQTPAEEQNTTESREPGTSGINPPGTSMKTLEESEANGAPPPSSPNPENEDPASVAERADAAEATETPSRAPTSISVLSASQDSMIIGNGVVGDEEEANEEDETRAGAFTPATKDKEDDEDSESDSDDEDDTAPQLGVQSTSAATRTAAIMVKLPRPALEEICDCALLALGPRSGCTPDEVIDWINTSPLGQALKSRLKSQFEDRNVYKSLKRHATRGRYESLRVNYMMSTERLDEIGATDSLAKVRRARREQKGTASATAVKESVSQMRLAHNEEVKKGVMEAAFARWSYMVRKLSALEPFISENAKNKILRFKELLELNNFGELARADLDDHLEKWSKTLFETRKTLDFHTMGEEAPNVGEELPQPKGIENGELRAYQRRGLSWLMRMFQNGCNAVLADEMGLGKTLQTISFLTHLKESGVQGPFLVIVPLSVLTNWANEFRKWSPSLRVVKLHSSNREERDRRKKEVLNNFKDFDAVVTTYEMIVSPNMKNVLTSKLWWRCVVIDEGHKIKNDETSLSQAVRSMNCQYRLLLTGTPLQNNLHELWAMLNFLDPVVFDSSDKFDAGFDLARDIVDRELLAKAHYLLRPFCLRRTKLEVESKLPPKEEIVVNIPLSEMQTFWYKRLILNDAELLERVEDQIKGDLDEGTNNVNSTINGAGTEDANNPASVNDWKRLQSLMMQLRKCCNHPYLFPGAEPDFDGTTSEDIVDASGKLQMLDRLLKKLQEKGHRVVIFSQFTAMLDILSDFLNLRGYKHARLDGSTNRVQRAVDVLQYNQADSTHFAYLMSTRAGGLGINLATADTVILYDSDWNPQVDLQAMDRVHRIGQEKPVHVYRLVTKGTVEERIVQRAKKKLYLDSMVNRGSTAQSEALEGLSKAEMLKMLKFGASAVFGESDGEMVKPLTDAELDAMVNRSPEAMKARQEATSGDDSMAKGDNALDFEMDKTQNVSLREMYGKDFVQEVMARTESVSPVNDGTAVPNTPSSSSAAVAVTVGSATTEERPVKRQRGRKRKSEVDPNASVLPEISVQDIASDWKKLKAASNEGGAAAGAGASATKSGRKIKQRFTKVGGYNVLKSNTYSLEDGEKSVFSSELANRRKGPDAATLEEINRSLGRGRQVAGRDYTNEQHCLACWDGGELVLCDQCPVAVHLECLNPSQAPPEKSRGNPTWRCPHHTCVQCERKSAAAGGLLFRCSECLNAFCEDHLPLEGFKLHDEGRCLRFEELGFRKPTQGYYILCSKSCQTFYNDRVEFGSEEAIRRAVDRMSGGDGMGSSNSAQVASSSQTKGRKRKAK